MSIKQIIKKLVEIIKGTIKTKDDIPTVTIIENWDSLIFFFKYSLTETVTQLQTTGHATQFVIIRLKNSYQRIVQKTFYKENDTWFQVSTIVEINEKKVPEHIKAKVSDCETDITKEMELELSMEL